MQRGKCALGAVGWIGVRLVRLGVWVLERSWIILLSASLELGTLRFNPR